MMPSCPPKSKSTKRTTVGVHSIRTNTTRMKQNELTPACSLCSRKLWRSPTASADKTRDFRFVKSWVFNLVQFFGKYGHVIQETQRHKDTKAQRRAKNTLSRAFVPSCLCVS